MAAKSPEQTYTDPALRQRLKDEIMEGDKGGRSGQWSARKSQLLVHEYEKAGGGYLSEKPTEAQEHLHEWTEEKWTTQDGQPAAQADGMHRYLPKEAWDKLSPEEKAATEQEKHDADAAGHQFALNTNAAKEARAEAQEHEEKEHGDKEAGH